jgi:hypothetical protein
VVPLATDPGNKKPQVKKITVQLYQSDYDWLVDLMSKVNHIVSESPKAKFSTSVATHIERITSSLKDLETHKSENRMSSRVAKPAKMPKAEGSRTQKAVSSKRKPTSLRDHIINSKRPFTVSQIVERYGVSAPTVKRCIDDLMSSKLVVERGVDPKRKGKGRSPMRYSSTKE